MNEDPCFANSILAIGDTPFYLFYATPTQFHTYAEYLRIYRKYSSICIDATGGLVKKLTDSRDKKTGYIFLYQVVINFKGTSISVYQMLSETHDAKFISFWLSRWVQKVNPPREAVSDGSKALLNAMSDSFNGKSLKEYINFCFENLIGNTNLEPRTFIRLDTAHFIHSVSRWECFQSVLHKIVKSFYLYCTALMIDCKRLSQLEGIFILTLIVSGTEFEDSIISVSDDCIITPVEARNQLEKFISICNPDLTVIDSIEIDTEKTMIFDQSSCGVDKNGWSLALLVWIDNLCKKANTIIFTGSKLNSFYMPKLYVRLVEIIKEFPLWTNVCTPDTMPRATSSYIEADFKDLKMNLKKKVKLPTTEIKFLKLHIVDLLGGVNIFRSKLTKFVVDNCSEEELNKPKDENLFENWKGLGKDGNSNDYDWIDDYVNSSMDKDDQSDSVSPLKDKDGLNYSVNLSESHIDHNYSANYLEEKNDANKIINISSTITKNYNSLTAISSRNRHDEDIIAAAHTGDDNNTLITLLSKDLHDQDSIITSDAAKDVNNNLNMLLSKNHHEQDISIATTDAGDPNDGLNILLSKSYHHRNDVIKLRNPNNLSKVIENDNKKNTPELLTMKQHSGSLSAAVEAMVQQKSINKEVGLYFQNFPEIKLRNNLVDVKKTKIFLLGNGNKSGPVVFNGKKWTALNTCPFDTIIQLIFVGALDSTRFHKYITNLDIPVFKFLNDFMKKGPTKEIYQQRMSILHPIYNVSIVDKKQLEEKDMMKINVSPTINCYDNISKLWQTLLKNAPSVIETSFCSNSSCQVHTQALPVLTVNHKTIDRCGFIALEKALSFYNKIFNVQCRFCNKAKATRVTVPKEYLFLELDIRGNINASSGKRCKLSQFPIHLNLKITDNRSETTLSYRLSGVAAYRTGHYFAYCRRLSGSWQIYNNSSAKPESAALSTEVEPHGVYYILE
ncbi:120.7 kDa protein in NOF-FB transposable element isoform X1 [Microplitis demolitor]|uniref:120.7 kDa protein in NOF-FB transposable element isoform X1 n=1 Tax=Microplitis demolitor TaxID=69319 RepID=UPI00235B6C84|nr:120.7 kDa protein in NOF-FB transposable element isoform X1 [Microplitis demolitor]XP_053595593.1 120.7 kDa protein in NOF-FB transposable element isoform X1 [Microplitis demolitor]XP_053595596.1 120.7 kDa protein in NOF-FB transposable element isoform X1 [Microplitis demolitor]